MKLIADSGSTKTSWALIDNDKPAQVFSTRGYNPYYYADQEFKNILEHELMPQICDTNAVKSLFFYGSGCSSSTNCFRVETALQPLFPQARIEVNHDLYGAALALLHRGKGIACILGTGSNSCVWDGEKIVENVPSLGFLLADEGSGTTIGKNLLTGLLKGEADPEITKAFYDRYELTFEKTLDLLYKQPEPNRFMAQLTKFASDHIDNQWCRAVIKKSFDDFITRNIKFYQNYQRLPIVFTGSIAHHFKEILAEACAEHELTMGEVLKDPIHGLIEFHQSY